MDYTDLGFDIYFNRELKEYKIPQLTEEDVNKAIQTISANKIDSGVLRSKDGSLIINLEDGTITKSDGATITEIA